MRAVLKVSETKNGPGLQTAISQGTDRNVVLGGPGEFPPLGPEGKVLAPKAFVLAGMYLVYLKLVLESRGSWEPASG